ncbi:MAG: response regulator transcription factor [Ignavibacteria bacterium]|nr:response regulator transcription factor [Ignavibacteria bacterium]
MPKKKTTIFIIEDNRMLRDGISAMINEQPDLKVIASLSERLNSLTKIITLEPDIVLIDLGLRSQNSLEVVRTIRDKSPDIKIIVMDLLPAQTDILDYVKAGASGFILKNAMVHEFLQTIRTVESGEKVLPPHMTNSLFTQIVERAVNGTKNSNFMKSLRMTKREREVIELIADGLTNKEIGNILHLSPYTVKSHVHNILEKMALHTRVQIATFAHTSKEHKDSADSESLSDDDE